MNNNDRKKIQEWIDTLDQIREDVETMQNGEQDKLDNMPEGLQESERGEKMQEGIDNLESAIDSLRDAIDYLNDAME